MEEIDILKKYDDEYFALLLIELHQIMVIELHKIKLIEKKQIRYKLIRLHQNKSSTDTLVPVSFAN